MSHYECNKCGYGGNACVCPPKRGTLAASPAQTTIGGAKCESVVGAGSGANSRQVGGAHYRKVAGAPQHWDFVLAHGIPYMEAQIIKYVMRWRDKGGLQDLEKAKHFLEKLIEHESK